MRPILFAICFMLLVGCVTRPDAIDNLVAKLSATPGWDEGLSRLTVVPETAPPKQVLDEYFKTRIADGKVTNYKILRTRQVRITLPGRADLEDPCIAVLVQTNLGEKIVILRYLAPTNGWWSQVYDAKPSA
jgi:hypothetical protein